MEHNTTTTTLYEFPTFPPLNNQSHTITPPSVYGSIRAARHRTRVQPYVRTPLRTRESNLSSLCNTTFIG